MVFAPCVVRGRASMSLDQPLPNRCVLDKDSSRSLPTLTEIGEGIIPKWSLVATEFEVHGVASRTNSARITRQNPSPKERASKGAKFGTGDGLFVAESNAAFVEAVGGELYFDFVAGEDLDVVHPHLAGDVAEDHVSVVQLHAEGCVGEGFDHFAVDFDYVVFCHGYPLCENDFFCVFECLCVQSIEILDKRRHLFLFLLSFGALAMFGYRIGSQRFPEIGLC